MLLVDLVDSNAEAVFPFEKIHGSSREVSQYKLLRSGSVKSETDYLKNLLLRNIFFREGLN